MKITSIIIIILVMTAFAGNAQTVKNGKNQPVCKPSYSFVDNNKNGICDNKENAVNQSQIRKRNNTCTYNNGKNNQGNRRGNNQASQQNRRRDFVDTNNNGICDRMENPK